jgi:predicted transglutaminase-like cysteine proteinase
MTATAEQLAQLRQVNTRVDLLPYEALPGKAEPPDWWTNEPVAGNSWVCRDYVEMKADQLKALGWAAPNLTTIICWTEVVGDPSNQWGGRECHAILGVDTGGDGWILDSRADDIYPATAPVFDYRWIEQQIPNSVDFADVSTSGLSFA